MNSVQLNTEVVYEGIDLGLDENSKIKAGDSVAIYKVLLACIENVDVTADLIYIESLLNELSQMEGLNVNREISEKTKVFFDIFNKYFEMLSVRDKKYWVRLVLSIMVNYFSEDYNVSKGYQGFVNKILEEYDICKFIRVERLREVSLGLYQSSLRNTKYFKWSLEMIVEADMSKSLFRDIRFIEYRQWQELGYSLYEIIEYYERFAPFMKVFGLHNDLERHHILIKDLLYGFNLRLVEISQKENMTDYEYKFFKNSDCILNRLRNCETILLDENKDDFTTGLEKIVDLCLKGKKYSRQFVYIADILKILEKKVTIEGNEVERINIKERFPSKEVKKNLTFKKENILYINVEYWIALLEMHSEKLESIYGNDLVINVMEKKLDIIFNLEMIQKIHEKLVKNPEREEELTKDLESAQGALRYFMDNFKKYSLNNIEKEWESLKLNVKISRVIEIVNFEEQSILGLKVIADSKYYEMIKIVLETMLLRNLNNDIEGLDAMRIMVMDKWMRLDLEENVNQNTENNNVKVIKF